VNEDSHHTDSPALREPGTIARVDDQ